MSRPGRHCHTSVMRRADHRMGPGACRWRWMNHIELIGFLGAGLMIVTLAMRTMIPLRMVGIASNVVQIAFAVLAGITPMLIQHAILLPMNVYRHAEQLRLVKK